MEDTKTYVEFMAKEVELNEHIRQALEELQKLNNQLDQAELLAAESNILAALNTLGGILRHFLRLGDRMLIIAQMLGRSFQRSRRIPRFVQ